MFSAVFGIAKFLKTGPCRLVPSKGIFGGYLQLGFLLVLLNIGCTLLSKGLLLGFSGIVSVFSPKSEFPFLYVLGLWIGLKVMPEFIYVSKSEYNSCLSFATKYVNICIIYIDFLI